MLVKLWMPVTAALVLAATCWFSPDVGAQVYEWTDEDGNLHYSDTRRSNSELIDPARKADRNKRPLYLVDSEEDSPEARARAEQCKKAQAKLKEYREADTLIRKDELGQSRELTDEERIEQIVKTENSVKTLCADSGQ